MSLSDLGNLGEFIGSVAALIALVYLAFQVRSNTKAVRASTFLGLTNGWLDFIQFSAQPELADLIFRLGLEPDKLNPVERRRVWLYARGTFRRFENDYFQYKSGTFDAGAWLGYCNSLREEILSGPGMRALWTMSRDKFSPEFAALVDREAEAARAAGGSSEQEPEIDQWREALRREGAV